MEFGNGLIDGNRDGCLANRTGDVSAGSCAAKVQAQFDCGLMSCASCPIGDKQSIADLNSCAADAFAGACESFVTPEDCASTVMVDGGVDDCIFPGKTVNDWFTALVTQLCGA